MRDSGILHVISSYHAGAYAFPTFENSDVGQV